MDGQRLNQYDLEFLRKHISVVSQQPVLFEGTVMENIRMGHKDATEDEIINLCKSLGIHQTIVRLSNVNSFDDLVYVDDRLFSF